MQSISTGVQTGLCGYSAHLYGCILSTRPPCRLSLNQHCSHLALRGLLSCLPSNPWSLQPCISTHQLRCYFKLLGLLSGNLTYFCTRPSGSPHFTVTLQ